MTPSLLSPFDPCLIQSTVSFPFFLFWFISVVSFSLVSPSLWLLSSRQGVVVWGMFVPSTVVAKSSAVIRMPGFSVVLGALMILLALWNLCGLLPFTFSLTAHLAVSVPLAFTLWGAVTLAPLVSNVAFMFEHLIPKGTPWYLAPTIFFLEALSVFVRPITLALRLTANICAGHLLLSMFAALATPLILVMSPSAVLVSFALLPLNLLEIAVALIQAFVFIQLLSSYAMASSGV